MKRLATHDGRLALVVLTEFEDRPYLLSVATADDDYGFGQYDTAAEAWQAFEETRALAGEETER